MPSGQSGEAAAAGTLLSGSAAFAGAACGLAVSLAALAVSLFWRGLWQRRIGGYTGDVVGALIELVEMAALVVVALGMAAWA